METIPWVLLIAVVYAAVGFASAERLFLAFVSTVTNDPDAKPETFNLFEDETPVALVVIFFWPFLFSAVFLAGIGTFARKKSGNHPAISAPPPSPKW